jgi:hypothetical protein
MRRLITTLMLFSLALPCWGADYFVNPGAADDTGNGESALTAKKYIDSGIALMSTGDTLYCNGTGTHATSGGTAIAFGAGQDGMTLTLQPYAGSASWAFATTTGLDTQISIAAAMATGTINIDGMVATTASTTSTDGVISHQSAGVNLSLTSCTMSCTGTNASVLYVSNAAPAWNLSVSGGSWSSDNGSSGGKLLNSASAVAARQGTLLFDGVSLYSRGSGSNKMFLVRHGCKAICFRNCSLRTEDNGGDLLAFSVQTTPSDYTGLVEIRDCNTSTSDKFIYSFFYGSLLGYVDRVVVDHNTVRTNRCGSANFTIGTDPALTGRETWQGDGSTAEAGHIREVRFANNRILSSGTYTSKPIMFGANIASTIFEDNTILIPNTDGDSAQCAWTAGSGWSCAATVYLASDHLICRGNRIVGGDGALVVCGRHAVVEHNTVLSTIGTAFILNENGDYTTGTISSGVLTRDGTYTFTASALIGKYLVVGGVPYPITANNTTTITSATLSDVATDTVYYLDGASRTASSSASGVITDKTGSLTANLYAGRYVIGWDGRRRLVTANDATTVTTAVLADAGTSVPYYVNDDGSVREPYPGTPAYATVKNNIFVSLSTADSARLYGKPTAMIYSPTADLVGAANWNVECDYNLYWSASAYIVGIAPADSGRDLLDLDPVATALTRIQGEWDSLIPATSGAAVSNYRQRNDRHSIVANPGLSAPVMAADTGVVTGERWTPNSRANRLASDGSTVGAVQSGGGDGLFIVPPGRIP